jgi:flavin reductase (DIM6/NTAB) family NADH-FMN oxidoreductase RutF
MDQAVPQALEPRALRRAFGRFATGVTIVTAHPPDAKPEGMTANSFASLSLDPPLLLWCPQRRAPSLPAFEAAGHFAVHVLRASQRALAEHFARPSPDKFAGQDWQPGRGGAPLLPGCLARFECATEALLPGGDHVIMIGRILHAEAEDGEPLVYSAGAFCVPAPHAEGRG